MTSRPPWIELLTVGFVYLAAVVFLVLALLDVRTLVWSAAWGDAAVYVVPVALASAYLTGWVVVRGLSAVTTLFPEWVKRPFTGVRISPRSPDAGPRPRSLIVWQYGSEGLVAVLNENWWAMALLRSLVVGLPCLTASATVWLAGGPGSAFVPMVVGAGFLATAALVVAHRQQFKEYHGIAQAAAEMLKPDLLGSIDNGSSGSREAIAPKEE